VLGLRNVVQIRAVCAAARCDMRLQILVSAAAWAGVYIPIGSACMSANIA
jgi:hypothetical protein